MIAYIRGALVEKESDHIVVEAAGGVGYHIYYPSNSVGDLPGLGEEVKIYIHYASREDGVYLFGFPEKSDRELFELLISVSGIGPKGAMAILGSAKVEHLLSCIASGEVSGLIAVPGIGKKTADRIVLELREKIRKLVGKENTNLLVPKSTGGYDEALQALMALGFPLNKAKLALSALPQECLTMQTEEIIRQALTALDEQRR